MMFYDWQPQIDDLCHELGLAVEEVRELAFERVAEFSEQDRITFPRKVLFVLGEKQKQ